MVPIRNKIYGVIETGIGEPHWLSKLYDVLMSCAIVASLIPLMFTESRPIFEWMDSISCGLFIIDYLLRWLTADLHLPKYGKWSFLLYPFSLMAIIDLLSILPSISALNSAFKVLRTTRLVKIFRVVKLFRYYEPLQLVIRVLKKERAVLITVLALALFYIFVIALVIFNVEGVNPVTGELVFPSFLDALYWATCTVTNMGFDSYYPATTVGKTICIISATVGVAIIALPAGAVTSAYMEEIRIRNEQRHKVKGS